MKFMKRSLTWLSALLTVGALATPTALADTTNGIHPYPKLVALGDSITFGYNLGPNNNHPSREAYPFLIGKDLNFQVRDISQPGWTSGDLLNALQTSRYMRESVKYANVVTIDIGSNDILHIATTDGLLSPTNPNPNVTPAELQQFATAITGFGQNLQTILAMVHTLAPNAGIILYNIYNPIPSLAPNLHALGEKLIGQENTVLTKIASAAGIPVADAYSAFNGKQTTLVRAGDVHPTVAGQQALAAAGEAALHP